MLNVKKKKNKNSLSVKCGEHANGVLLPIKQRHDDEDRDLYQYDEGMPWIDRAIDGAGAISILILSFLVLPYRRLGCTLFPSILSLISRTCSLRP